MSSDKRMDIQNVILQGYKSALKGKEIPGHVPLNGWTLGTSY